MESFNVSKLLNITLAREYVIIENCKRNVFVTLKISDNNFLVSFPCSAFSCLIFTLPRTPLLLRLLTLFSFLGILLILTEILFLRVIVKLLYVIILLFNVWIFFVFSSYLLVLVIFPPANKQIFSLNTLYEANRFSPWRKNEINATNQNQTKNSSKQYCRYGKGHIGNPVWKLQSDVELGTGTDDFHICNALTWYSSVRVVWTFLKTIESLKK